MKKEKKLDTIAAWEAQSKKTKIYSNVTCALFIVSFFTCLVIGIVNISSMKVETLFILSLVILELSAMAYSGFDMRFRNIKGWRKRIPQNNEAINELATGIEFEIRQMGLEPINKIELKRKSSQ